ncbi:hypothetical protein SSS_06661 [Sarcoptes scabiei]|uniref:Uncharacterized protein n=1 Tax=Sarcoptes scabiei TaxID=52283 RepID=A0A834R8Q9_SARSC|nr:hypothetical protein SSS_06661 [Sarcoptes scabiei]
MAIYRFWLISIRDRSILYSRFFPHLERKDKFVFPSISSEDFLRYLFISLGIDRCLDEIKQQRKQKKSSELGGRNIVSEYDESNRSSPYRARSSSSSNCSLTSSISSSTISTPISKRSDLFDPISSSPLSSLSIDSNLSEESVCLYNHLPLIVYPLISRKNLDSSLESDEKVQEDDFITNNLILLVYEQNGLLFVCSPRLIPTKDSIQYSRTVLSCSEIEKLVIENQYVSVAFTILDLIASHYSQTKSVRMIENFISETLPFGNLIRTKILDLDHPLSSSISSNKQTKLSSKEFILHLELSESISTSFHHNQSDSIDETVFGTMKIETLQGRSKFSQSEFLVHINNLDACTLTLPNNCQLISNTKDGQHLCYDLLEQSESNLNVLHYKSLNRDELKMKYFDRKQSTRSRLFRTSYTINRRHRSIESKTKNSIDSFSITDSENVLHHLNLQLFLDETIDFEQIRFKFFTIKFSLKHSLAKRQVQTIHNSLPNLIVRDSIKVNQGEISNANDMIVWNVGKKLSRRKKLSIEFDFIVNCKDLANLETQCYFSYRNQTRFSLMKSISKNINPLLFQNKPNCSGDENSIQMEAKFASSSEKITPFLQFFKFVLKESRKISSLHSQTQEKSRNEKVPDPFWIQFDYQLNSFEYRLYPKTIE